jgi:hypothetical protein
MVSLGREPQDSGRYPHPEPCRGDRFALRREPQRFHVKNLSPLRGFSNFFRILFLGLTPQAIGLSPLRGSGPA